MKKEELRIIRFRDSALNIQSLRLMKLIYGGTIVNEGRKFIGSIIIDGDRIEKITEGKEAPRGIYDETIDATGCFVMPGIIDEHVHFREPGMTEKATIESESRAAA